MKNKEIYENDIIEIYTHNEIFSNYKYFTFRFDKLVRLSNNDVVILINTHEYYISSSDVLHFDSYTEPSEFGLKLEMLSFNILFNELLEKNIPIISYCR